MNEYPTIRIPMRDVKVGDYDWLGSEIVKAPEWLGGQWVMYVNSSDLGIIPQYYCGNELSIQDRENVIDAEYRIIDDKGLLGDGK